jgi:hypothetical protein
MRGCVYFKTSTSDHPLEFNLQLNLDETGSSLAVTGARTFDLSKGKCPNESQG